MGDAKAKGKAKEKEAKAPKKKARPAPKRPVELNEWEEELRPGGMGELKRYLADSQKLPAEQMAQYTAWRVYLDNDRQALLGRAAFSVLLVLFMYLSGSVAGRVTSGSIRTRPKIPVSWPGGTMGTRLLELPSALQSLTEILGTMSTLQLWAGRSQAPKRKRGTQFGILPTTCSFGLGVVVTILVNLLTWRALAIPCSLITVVTTIPSVTSFLFTPTTRQRP